MKKTKKKIEADLTSLIMSHAINDENGTNFFLYNLQKEIKSILLVRDILKKPEFIGKITSLEARILKEDSKIALKVLKNLRDKFPYVEN